MTEPTSNDNEPVVSRASHHLDAPGQAAILLVESLIHGLIARSIISIEDAIAIVDTATEVKNDIAADLGDSASPQQAPLTILASIAASLRFDEPAP